MSSYFTGSDTVITISDPVPQEQDKTIDRKPDPSKKEVRYFETRMGEREYRSWREIILQGKSLPPEVVGELIGRAWPVYKDENKNDEPTH